MKSCSETSSLFFTSADSRRIVFLVEAKMTVGIDLNPVIYSPLQNQRAVMKTKKAMVPRSLFTTEVKLSRDFKFLANFSLQQRNSSASAVELLGYTAALCRLYVWTTYRYIFQNQQLDAHTTVQGGEKENIALWRSITSRSCLEIP